MNENGERFPADLSGNEVDKLIVLWVTLMRMIYAQRVIITLGLCIVKFAFLAVFWDMRQTSMQTCRVAISSRFLRFVSIFMAASTGMTTWLVVRDNAVGFPLDPLIEEDIR